MRSVNNMTFRISEIAEPRGTTLRLDGRLSGEMGAELERVSEEAKRPLTLDLSGLSFADAGGVEILKAIHARGATLQNVPAYVALLLGHNGVVLRRTSTRARVGPIAAEKLTH